MYISRECKFLTDDCGKHCGLKMLVCERKDRQTNHLEYLTVHVSAMR